MPKSTKKHSAPKIPFGKDLKHHTDHEETPDQSGKHTAGKHKNVLGIGGMGDKKSKTKSTMKEKVKAKPSLSQALMKYK